MNFAEIKWNNQGLIPVITQDINSDEVLMLAWMNLESLNKTITSKNAWYFSRSRKQLWRKGEQSGNVQKVKEIYLDCDQDTILLKVEQTGVACHTGAKNCFIKKIV